MSLPATIVRQARYAGFAGLKNGELLLAAKAAGFEVMITVDRNIPHQLDIGQGKIAIVILQAPTNRLRHLKVTVAAAVRALESIRPGQIVIVA